MIHNKLNRPYDIKSLILAIVGIMLLSVAMRVTGGAGFAVMVPIAFFALMGGKMEHLIFILLLSITTIVANGSIMPKDMVYGITERGLYIGLGFLLMTQVVGRRHPPYLKPLLGLLFYIAFMAFTSGVGWSPMISYLKLFLFTSIFMGYYAIAMRASSETLDVRKLRAMLLAVASFFIIGSIFARSYGWAYMSVEELVEAPIDGNNLYKGMTCHSNALGGTLTVFAILLLCDMLFTLQKVNFLYMVNIIVALYFIVQSGSRTAMGAFILSAGFAFYCFLSARSITKGWKSRVFRGGLILSVVFGFILLLSASGRDHVLRFIVKQRDEDAAVIVTAENVLSSRQGKLDEGIAHWRESPLVGNGFQVSKDMKEFRVRSLASILSAPVEKSVWVTAILEEGGVLGFGLFVIFLLRVFPTLIRRKAYIGATMLFSLVCANLGEFTIFSMSGGGGMQWGAVFVGLIFDGQRLKRDDALLFRPA